MRTKLAFVQTGFGILILLGAAALIASHQNSRADNAQEPDTQSPASTPVHAAWKDLSGRAWSEKDFARHKATVFVFVSTQCPIANIYSPRINELAQKYTTSDVQFFLVDSNLEDSAAALKRYIQERGYRFPAVKDVGTSLADALSADRTPETIIVDQQGAVRYRGRIDDNTDREKIIRHDASEALDALLDGKPIARARTLAFGCAVFRDTPVSKTQVSHTVTYTRDVAPILARNCVSCHRQGESAPFALESYQQAKIWALPIKTYTARRQMPPWKAAPGYGDFHDARLMSDQEIAVLGKWADAGAPQGNLKDLRETSAPAPRAEWQLGRPDLILQPTGTYHLEAEGKDVYREFVLPADFKEDQFINAIEFKPDNRAVVHHIIVFFDPSGMSAKLDGKEEEPGYSVPGVGIGTPQSVWVAGWAAGATPYRLPEGAAYRLPAGDKIVLQVHYHKDGKVEADRSRIGLHFADKAKVDKEIHVASLINAGFHLKAGNSHQEVKASMTVAAPVHVWAVFPHMHLLGREMKMTAELPDGSIRPLIWINDWDFNWQETYRCKESVMLPKGTKVSLTAVFDNSESNPRQPVHPPKDVFWGEQTTDEMCIGFFQYSLDSQHLSQQNRTEREQSVVQSVTDRTGKQ